MMINGPNLLKFVTWLIFSYDTVRDVELYLTSLSSEFVKINALEWRIKGNKSPLFSLPLILESLFWAWIMRCGWVTEIHKSSRPAIIWKTVQECYSSTICIPHLHRLDAMDCLLVTSESCGSYLSVFSWHVEHTRYLILGCPLGNGSRTLEFLIKFYFPWRW